MSVENAESVPGAFVYYVVEAVRMTSSYRRVAEIRDPVHNRLLGKLYLDTGIMEIMSKGTLFQFDVRGLLLNTQPTQIAQAEVMLNLESKTIP